MEALELRIERLLGSRPVTFRRRAAPWQPSEAIEGGNDRFSVELADGRRVFVKLARAPHTASWIRREAEVYEHLHGSFMPALVAFDDDAAEPMLVLEDLSRADWDIAWDPRRVAAVRRALRELAGSTPPPNTLPIRVAFPELFGQWEVVASDPEPFLGTGIRSREWLDAALPVLRSAADAARVDGDDLLHLDVRSDNLCFRDGRAILVDWNWCCLGAADLDVAQWLPSLAMEGGPPPWEVLPGGARYGALLAGVWAARVGLPAPTTAPTIREMQRRQLQVVLAWCERDLGL
jgi:thiamine kinase-like enzyme